MTPKHLFDLCRKAAMAWIDDFAPSMGAAIAYYTMFSLAPLLVIVIAIAGALFGREAVQGEIVAQLSDLIGEEGAIAVQGLVRSASEPGKSLMAGLISIAVLLVGATTVFAELQNALDRIWHVPEKDKPSGVWAVLRARLLSFGFALISLSVTTLLFAMIFKFMPTARIAWSDVWVGAAVTAVLFEIGKLLIGLYLGKSGFTESLAAAGSLVVLLAWVYYAAQIFLLGAEFTKVYADEHGSFAGAKALAATEAAAAAAAAGTDGLTGGRALWGEEPALATNHSGLTLAAEVKKEIERRVQSAAAALLGQLVLLGVLALASAMVARWQKKQLKAIRRRAAAP
ncbi:YihY/virulence factor BrkB family protein [Variovorax paradoxus]|nr:YihY/virulence factor BrkB family protein [Variovorax paradoxus]